jgi:hypothetical protein
VDEDVGLHLSAWQSVLPSSATFTHLTAAAARGWWLPPLPDGLPVFVAMARDRPRPRRHGLVAVRHPIAPVPVTVDGIRMSTAAETLLACARDLSLIDLLVLTDAALHAGDVTAAELGVAAGQRRRGVPRLRKAITLADGRSESPWETLLRVFHVSCGVAVTPQFTVRDQHGNFVARGDLRLDGTSTLHEYDGADHRTGRQQTKDLRRDRRLGNATWVRRGYTSADLLLQPIGILRDADATIGREHDPSRIRAWHRLVRESCFSPAGLAALTQRLGLACGSGHSATA